MSALLGSLRQVSRWLTPSLTARPMLSSNTSSNSTVIRHKSSDPPDKPSHNYSPYTDHETPSPFIPLKPSYKFGYKQKYYKGGPLPRSEKLKDKPIKHLPPFKPHERDQWTTKKALFGQNDYIDILGDGTVHPADLIVAPLWVKGFRGNELQRLARQLKFQGPWLKLNRPEEYHNIEKQIKFLYKRYNRRRSHSNYWSGRRGQANSRLFNFKKW